jgi:hypothetical protein
MKIFFLILLWLSVAVAQRDVAAVRLGHFSPDAPLLDLLVDGTLHVRDIHYTELSSYLVLPAGEHELQVFPHRAPNQPSSGDSLAEEISTQAPEPFITTVTLEAGKYYTLLALGYFDPPPSQDQLGALSLRLTHSATVTITGPRAYATTLNQSTDLTDLFPGVYAATASQEGFKTAQYEVEVRASETSVLSITLQANEDTETSESAPVVVEDTGASLEWRKMQLQLYEDELVVPPPGAVLVRVIHASPITPSVSVILEYRNEESETSELSADLTYPNEVDYLPVKAGRVSFRLQATATNEIITELADLELEAGTVYTFFIVGTRSDSFVAVIPSIDALLAVGH